MLFLLYDVWHISSYVTLSESCRQVEIELVQCTKDKMAISPESSDSVW